MNQIWGTCEDCGGYAPDGKPCECECHNAADTPTAPMPDQIEWTVWIELIRASGAVMKAADRAWEAGRRDEHVSLVAAARIVQDHSNAAYDRLQAKRVAAGMTK